MEIIMDSIGVVIKLKNDVSYAITFHELDQVEKAIEIIRQLHKIVPVKFATIEITWI